MKKLLALLLLCSPVSAQTFTSVPYTFAPNTAVIPGQLMANFLSLIASGNTVSSNLNSKLSSFITIPSGVQIFFNLGSCPTGWSTAGGNSAFIRGLDNGAGNDTTGTGLGGLETNGMQDHTHNTSLIIPNIDAFSFVRNGNLFFYPNTGVFSSVITGLPSTGNHGPETRPANVSLLLCSKN